MASPRAKEFFLVVLGLVAGGCMQGGPETLEPTASMPTLGTRSANRRGVSTLIVATPPKLDYNVGHPEDGPLRRPTGYTIYDDRGRKLQYVRNYIGALDTEPTIIELEPGRYLILLEKPDHPPPAFWVEIEAGKTTEVRISP